MLAEKQGLKREILRIRGYTSGYGQTQPAFFFSLLRVVVVSEFPSPSLSLSLSPSPSLPSLLPFRRSSLVPLLVLLLVVRRFLHGPSSALEGVDEDPSTHSLSCATRKSRSLLGNRFISSMRILASDGSE